MRGNLIVVESHDQAGKTTLVKVITNYYIKKKERVVGFKLPNREGIHGQLIDQHLKGQVKLDNIQDLFYDNCKESLIKAKHYIDHGIHVIFDRYIYSNAVYNHLTNPSKPLMELYKGELELVKPDMVLLIDGYHTREEVEEIYEKKELLTQIFDLFITLFAELNIEVQIINNRVSREESSTQVIDVIKRIKQ